jgi:hypothetical protein
MAEEQSNDVLLGVQDLTDEERQELENQIPSMLAGAEAGKLIAQRALAAWIANRRGLSIEEEAMAAGKEMRDLVQAAQAQGGEQGSLAGWFGFPTVLTRTSPFFPKNRKDLATGEGRDRAFLRNYVITAAGWGELLYSGPLLTTYDEDALWAVLAALDTLTKYRRTTTVEGIDEGGVAVQVPTFSYSGPVGPLMGLMGYKNPSSADRRRFVDSLELMLSGVIKMAHSGGKTKAGKKKAPKREQMNNILSNVDWTPGARHLEVTVNPFFYARYYSAQVSIMDMAVRSRLKSPIAKALYRFVQSHRTGKCFEGHFLTLCDVLNLERDQPLKELRRLLKTAISALVRQGVLTKKSGFVSQDYVLLDRADGALPAPKTPPKLPKKK